MTYTAADLHTYLDWIEFPRLDLSNRTNLEQDIFLEEVQLAMTQLKPGKTPGEDGLSTEFFTQHLDLLTQTYLLLLLVTVFSTGSPARFYVRGGDGTGA